MRQDRSEAKARQTFRRSALPFVGLRRIDAPVARPRVAERRGAGHLLRMTNGEAAGFRKLVDVVARLRGDGGCPWDKKQTPQSMAPTLLEEAYEAIDALRRGDARESHEELGDVLINVAMVAQMFAEAGGPNLDAIAASAADKLVRRHPHVFDGKGKDADHAAFAGWEQRKREERLAQGRAAGALDGVPDAMASLLRAYRIGQKAAKVGFDWPDRRGPREKIDEELRELDAAAVGNDAAAIRDELGDVLFSVCNLARHLGVEPETALRGTVDKFVARFRFVEQELGPDLGRRTLDEMEASWQRAKQRPSRGAEGDGAPSTD